MQILLCNLQFLGDTSMATKYCSLNTSLPQTRDLISHQGHQGEMTSTTLLLVVPLTRWSL